MLDRGYWFSLCMAVMLCCAGCNLRGRPASDEVVRSRSFCQQGISAIERGQLDKAEDLLSQAVGACPVDAESRRQYGEVLWRTKRHDEALEQLRKAAELSPEDPLVRVRLAEILLEQGKLDAAALMADEALDRDPLAPQAWLVRGRINTRKAEFGLALGDLQRCLELADNPNDALLEIAEVYRRTNRPERALANLQSLLHRLPAGEEPPNVLYLAGLASQAMGQYDVASQYYGRCVRAGVPNAEMLVREADCHLLAGRPAEAREAAQHALALQPKDPAALALWARIPRSPGSAPDVWRR
jgi:tetratricopeptide (TPR) repeat protein